MQKKGCDREELPSWIGRLSGYGDIAADFVEQKEHTGAFTVSDRVVIAFD